MRFLFGFYLDTKTKMLYDENGELQAFTFEPVDGNFFQFATLDTAEKILTLVSAWMPHVQFHIGTPDKPWVQHPFPQHVAPLMIKTDGAEFNAGLIASSVLRAGFALAKESFIADFNNSMPKEEN